MKHHRTPVYQACLLAGLFATGIAGAASLISPTLNNGSFESINGTVDTANTVKIGQWDGAAAGEIEFVAGAQYL